VAEMPNKTHVFLIRRDYYFYFVHFVVFRVKTVKTVKYLILKNWFVFSLNIDENITRLEYDGIWVGIQSLS